MPEGPDGKTIIIVKKVSGHGGHHGGAWKVAYADFVTAMMALFMVLWLVNSAAEPTRQRIASYFRKPGVFQKGSGTPMETGGGGILPDTFAPPADANSQIQVSDRIYEIEAITGKVREYFDPGEGDKKIHSVQQGPGVKSEQEVDVKTPEAKALEAKEQKAEEEKLEQLEKELEKAIEEAKTEQGGSALGDIEIKVDQRGLVIEIMDTEKSSMFQVGQAAMIGEAEQKLLNIAKVLAGLPNPVDIEGHTDGRPYRGVGKEKYDNWNLSSDRAHAARRVLEQAGMKKGQIARVVGYADERPKVLSDPLNPSNRRITISMRFSDQAKAQLEGTQLYETKPKSLLAEPPVQPNTAPNSQSQSAAPSNTAAGQVGEVGSAKAVAPVGNAAAEERPGVKVEIETTIPEGAVITAEPDEPPARPSGLDKDKIFGDKTSFFSVR